MTVAKLTYDFKNIKEMRKALNNEDKCFNYLHFIDPETEVQ